MRSGSRSAVRLWLTVCLIALQALPGGKAFAAAVVVASPPEAVTTAIARLQQVPRRYVVPGSVIADDRLQIASRVSGFIQALTVREGDLVKQGQLLVQIDPAQVRAQVQRAEAAVARARADLQDARRDVDKFSALVNQGGVPVDTLRKARVRQAIAEAALADARAALDAARSQLQYTRMVSPADGVVVARHQQVGDLAAPGAPILTLEARGSLVFRCYVPQREIVHLQIGSQVTVRIDNLAQPLRGEVLRLVPSGDEVTRRYEVKIRLSENRQVLPGMFGRALIDLGRRQALLAPNGALTERGGLPGVFVLEDGVVHWRWVRRHRQWPQGTEIVAGLSPGETLVLDPSDALVDGSPVANSDGAD